MYSTSVRIGLPYENNKSYIFMRVFFFFFLSSVRLQSSYYALPPSTTLSVKPFLQVVAKKEVNNDVS